MYFCEHSRMHAVIPGSKTWLCIPQGMKSHPVHRIQTNKSDVGSDSHRRTKPVPSFKAGQILTFITQFFRRKKKYFFIIGLTVLNGLFFLEKI
jgi:hypothetical protein